MLPKTLEEALKIPEWKKSAENKFNYIEELEVWEEVDDKEVTNPLNTVPVFKIKHNTHDDSVVYKTRLCIQGFNQKYGLDYFKTYAPTGKAALLRGILTYVAEKDLDMIQLDVKGAFLHSELDEQVFIKTPVGCNRQSKYLRLKKSL